MPKGNMCILHDASGQDGFLADQRDSNPGPETYVRDVVDAVQGLDHKVLELVGGNEGFSIGRETLDDGGGDGVLDGCPGLGRVGVPSPGPTTFVD